QFWTLAHQPFYEVARAVAPAIGKLHLQQSASAGLHGGLFELCRHHFAQALESRYIDLGALFEFLFEQSVAIRVIACIDAFAAMREPVKRRHGEKEMAV